MKNIINTLNNTTTEAPVQVVKRTFTTSIIAFDITNNKTIVKFRSEDGSKVFRATAHPALKVAPHLKKEQTLTIAETAEGWKLLAPYPTKEELEAYANRGKVATKKEYCSAEELALLNF